MHIFMNTRTKGFIPYLKKAKAAPKDGFARGDKKG